MLATRGRIKWPWHMKHEGSTAWSITVTRRSRLAAQNQLVNQWHNDERDPRSFHLTDPSREKNTCPWTSPEPGKNLRRASVSWAHETPLGSFVIFLWYPWILSAGLALCSCLSGIIKTIQRIPTGIFFGPLGNSNPMSKSISIEINPFQSSEILINSI